MIIRSLEQRIETKLFKGKAIILFGPRQAGKSTMVESILIEKEHLYLTSNLELNPYYCDLVKKSRVAAANAQQAKRVRRLSIGKMLIEANKNSESQKAKKSKLSRTKS